MYGNVSWSVNLFLGQYRNKIIFFHRPSGNAHKLLQMIMFLLYLKIESK